MGTDGERVIQGSRRPDGTYRKDVKVRAGYVPQDEQPVYVPRAAVVRLRRLPVTPSSLPGATDGTLHCAAQQMLCMLPQAMQGGPKVPGMDDTGGTSSADCICFSS